MDDSVDHSMLEEKFAVLKSFGKFLSDRLFDDARTGETNKRAWLGNIKIAEHRKAGGHTAGGGIGEDRYIRKPFSVKVRESRRNFRHLHQAQRAFLHARPARA